MVDDDVERLLQVGYTEDQIYEVTIATALGQGLRRLDAGLAAFAASCTRSEATVPAADDDVGAAV